MKMEFEIDIEKIKEEIQKELSSQWSSRPIGECGEEDCEEFRALNTFKYRITEEINDNIRKEIIEIFKEDIAYKNFLKEKIKKEIDGLNDWNIFDNGDYEKQSARINIKQMLQEDEELKNAFRNRAFELLLQKQDIEDFGYTFAELVLDELRNKTK